MLYYADRISDNIRRREPEGYLICVNVPIARSGTQQYLMDELDRRGGGSATVYRPEEEVFSEATKASFEGMPVTNDHPDAAEGVTSENIQWLQKGHAQNVRRGTGSESNLLLADLLITDPQTIQDVLNGKREISCGYTYELCEEDGKLVQRQIRGNHIAIVDRGRAGHRVCIKDSYPNKDKRKETTKMAKTKHGILAKMLASFARDAEPEEIAEAVEAIDEITSEDPEAIPQKDADVSEKLDTVIDQLNTLATPKQEEDEDEEEEKLPVAEAQDEDKLDTVIDLLKQLLAAKATDEEPKEVDPLKKLEQDLDELEENKQPAVDPEEAADEDEEIPEEEKTFAPDEDATEPESKFVDPEEINEEDEDEVNPEDVNKVKVDRRTCDAMRAAIKAVKPVIAQLPPSQRKAAADAAAASIRKSYGLNGSASRNDYLRLKQRRKAGDAAPRKVDRDLGARIMAARNANLKK